VKRGVASRLGKAGSAIPLDTGSFAGLPTVESAEQLQGVEEARGWLAAIVDSSDDAIISKTLDGTITSWNRGAESVFGYPAKEAVGQPMLMLIPPERVDEESDILARIRRGESGSISKPSVSARAAGELKFLQRSARLGMAAARSLAFRKLHATFLKGEQTNGKSTNSTNGWSNGSSSVPRN
jgi:PAS domain S-box-containing protein